ncbi:hypothetical protein [Leptospirillum ferrooxidans]|nr:hypothetical protein [Leptospirillum ferrooxidans]
MRETDGSLFREIDSGDLPIESSNSTIPPVSSEKMVRDPYGATNG